MAWTYSSSPSSVARDAVRLLVGQTSSGDDVLLTDAAIAFFLAETGSNYTAAAMGAEALAARYRAIGAEAERYGETGVTWGDRVAKFDMLALQLRRQGALRSVTPFLGGQSVTDRDARIADTDLRPPAFTVDQFAYGGFSTRGVTT